MIPYFFTAIKVTEGCELPFTWREDVHRHLADDVVRLVLIGMSEGWGLDLPDAGLLSLPLPAVTHPLRTLCEDAVRPLFEERTPITTALANTIRTQFLEQWRFVHSYPCPDFTKLPSLAVGSASFVMFGRKRPKWTSKKMFEMGWNMMYVEEYEIASGEVCLWEYAGPDIQDLLDMVGFFYTNGILDKRITPQTFDTKRVEFMTKYAHTLDYPIVTSKKGYWHFHPMAILPDSEHFAKLLADYIKAESVYCFSENGMIGCVFDVADVGGSPRIEQVRKYHWHELELPNEIFDAMPVMMQQRIRRKVPKKK